MNKQKIKQSKIALNFSESEFPLLLHEVGKIKLKAFIFVIRKKPAESKMVFISELYKKEKDMDVINKYIEEFDRFCKKVFAK